MTLYLDTALLVSAIVNEPSTPSVQTWLRRLSPEGFATSLWSITEISSALSMKVRTGELSHEQRIAILAVSNRLMASIDLVEVEAADFGAAADWLNRPESSIRSGDALHLAVAVRLGLPLKTLDKRFARDALILGQDVERLDV